MRDTNRGFAFIVGIGMTFLIFRLFGIGWIGDLRDYLAAFFSGDTNLIVNNYGQVLNREGIPIASPMAMLTEFIFEAFIAFGGASLLVLQGGWYMITQVFGWVGDFGQVGLRYLIELQRGTSKKIDAAPPAVTPFVSDSDAFAVWQEQQMKLSQALIIAVKSLSQRMDTLVAEWSEPPSKTETPNAE